MQRYHIAELPAARVDAGTDGWIDVGRPAGEVFSEAAISSFRNAPITMDHPYESVNGKRASGTLLLYCDGLSRRCGALDYWHGGHVPKSSFHSDIGIGIGARNGVRNRRPPGCPQRHIRHCRLKPGASGWREVRHRRVALADRGEAGQAQAVVAGNAG